jgi:cytoskeleton protein RodZ
MKTRTVGELLRAERENRQVSLDLLSTKSRIKLSLLEALEANQFELLPAAVFVKGYIKAYGRLLGFDHRPVVALLRRDFKESARGQLIPREFLTPVLRRRQFMTPFRLLVIGFILFFAVLFGYLAWQWQLVNRPPQLVITEPAVSATVAAQVVVKGLAQPDTVVLVNDLPVSLKPDGSFAAEIVLPTEGLATIKVTVTDRKGKQTTKERLVMVKY